MAIATSEYGLFIGGELVEPASGEVRELTEPATGAPLARAAMAGEADVDRAVDSAREALDGPWGKTPPNERSRLLHALADAVVANRKELTELETRNVGKAITSVKGEVAVTAENFRWYASALGTIAGRSTPIGGSILAYTLKEPIGVCAQIVPWNYPIMMAAWKLAPALAAGCAVVLKPDPATPLTALRLGELSAEVGFPPGAINIVPGDGPTTGVHLVTHPGVDKVAFTGSTRTGSEIMRLCAEPVKRVSLELGGKNPIVIWEDADLDLALDSVIWSAFGTSGQRCTAASRLIVHRAVHDEFVGRLRDRVGRLVLGDGLLETTDVGPVINETAVERIAGYAEIGRKEAELVIGGEPARDGDLAKGSFFQPTIFTEVKPDARIAQEEIFGPVASVIPVDSWEETVQIVNSVKYGLSSSLFTRDVNLAFRSIRDFDSGLGYVNHGTIGAEAHLPFGGTKATGNGHREVGQAALEFFSEWKSVYIDYSGKLQRAQIDTTFVDQE